MSSNPNLKINLVVKDPNVNIEVEHEITPEFVINCFTTNNFSLFKNVFEILFRKLDEEKSNNKKIKQQTESQVKSSSNENENKENSEKSDIKVKKTVKNDISSADSETPKKKTTTVKKTSKTEN